MKAFQYLFFIFLLLFSSFSFAQKSNSPSIGDVVKVEFEGEKVEANFVCIATTVSEENSDAQAIMNLNRALMGAEREALLLDVNFLMSDEPLKISLFVFGIETENSKNLTLEMFDEEGYVMVVSCSFDIKSGSNFNVVDLKNLDNGTYVFRLKDASGKELNRLLTIEKP